MTERQEQSALIAWANHMAAQIPGLAMLFAIPNQRIVPRGRRGWAYLRSLKDQGLKPGIPDLFLAAPSGIHAGMFIEMKYGRGKVSAAQQEWLDQLTFWGYYAVVARSFEEARDAILGYLGRQPHCGHPISAIESSDEGTQFCRECEKEGRESNA